MLKRLLSPRYHLHTEKASKSLCQGPATHQVKKNAPFSVIPVEVEYKVKEMALKNILNEAKENRQHSAFEVVS
jgi:hypothetical protein